jgi:hypothetical protein
LLGLLHLLTHIKCPLQLLPCPLLLQTGLFHFVEQRIELRPFVGEQTHAVGGQGRQGVEHCGGAGWR